MELILALKKFAVEALQYWKQLLLLAIIAVLMYGSYSLGSSNKANEYDIIIKKMQDDDISAHKQFEEDKQYIAQQYETWRATHPVIKNTKTYVSKADDEACKINIGFVKLHEESLYRTYSGIVANETDSGILLSTVGDVVSGNYGICLNEMKKLSSLQDIVRAYQKSQGAAK